MSTPVVGLADRTVDEVEAGHGGFSPRPLTVAMRRPTGRLTGTQQVSDVGILDFQLAAAPSGEALLTWTAAQWEPPAADDDLRFAIRGERAARFGEPVRVAGLAAAMPEYAPRPRLAMLDDGTAVYAYGRDETIRATLRPPGGTFGAPRTLARGIWPIVAAGGQDALVAWGDDGLVAARVRVTVPDVTPGATGAQGPISAFRGHAPEGDSRDWEEIPGWARGIPEALAAAPDARR